MPIKRTSKEKTVPVVFQMPAEMVSELKGKRAENDLGVLKEMKSSLAEFQDSFTQHRLSVQSELLKHRTGNKKEIEDLSKELEEAFDVLWPKFKSLETSLEKNSKEGKDSLSKSDKKHADSIAELASQVLSLSGTIEKRYQSALKKIYQQKGTIEVRIDEGETKSIKEELKRLDLLVKGVGKYEYGSSLNIFSGGNAVGFVGQINFKSGFTVALNNSGGVDVTSTGGAGFSILPVTGTINDSNKSFTVASLPSLVNINSGFYAPTGGNITWSYSGTTLTISSAVGVGGSIFAIG